MVRADGYRRFQIRLLRLAMALLACSVWSLPAWAEVRVTDQDGRERLFFQDVLGPDAVIINFVYTHCEGVCPSQGRRFQQLQKLLEDTGRRDVRLVSLSIDPERDSPAALKEWSRKFGAQKGWTLVAASRADTDALSREILGMTLTRSEHSPYLAIRTKSGRWKPLYGLTSANQILTQLNELSQSIH